VEPNKTINSLSEVSVLVYQLELTTHIIKESQHVCLDTLRWLLGDLDRSLQKRDGEVRVRTG
jgi:hypothetical protein